MSVLLPGRAVQAPEFTLGRTPIYLTHFMSLGHPRLVSSPPRRSSSHLQVLLKGEYARRVPIQVAADVNTAVDASVLRIDDKCGRLLRLTPYIALPISASYPAPHPTPCSTHPGPLSVHFLVLCPASHPTLSLPPPQPLTPTPHTPHLTPHFRYLVLDTRYPWQLAAPSSGTPDLSVIGGSIKVEQLGFLGFLGLHQVLSVPSTRPAHG